LKFNDFILNIFKIIESMYFKFNVIINSVSNSSEDPIDISKKRAKSLLLVLQNLQQYLLE